KSSPLAQTLSDSGPGWARERCAQVRRKPQISARLIQRVVEMTTRHKPAHATHWSTRTMATAVGISEASVRRIWHTHGLKPHLLQTFKVSRDPKFAEKLADIVGLYLNPP